MHFPERTLSDLVHKFVSPGPGTKPSRNKSSYGAPPCLQTTDGGARRIGLLIDSLIGGGAERVVLNLASAFRKLGHEVHIIVLRNEIQHLLPEGVAVHVLSQGGIQTGSKFLDKLTLAWRLRRLVGRIESGGRPFDFFVSNAEDSDRLSAMAGLEHVYIRYRNSMVEYMRHKIGHKAGWKRLWRKFKWQAHFRSVYGGRDIVTVSDALHADIMNDVGVRPRSIYTIYNPFDFVAIREQGEAFVPDIPGPYIVYVARFNSRKRQDLLLDAYAQSAASATHKLVLIGDAYTASERAWLDETKQRIVQLGLSHRVVLPGFQKNPYPWIRNAALFAMSSDSEGLPTVLIESLILGTPVVSTDCPTGPNEILTGSLTGFLCPRNKAPALAGLIDQALTQYPAITDAQLSRFSADSAARQYIAYCGKPRQRVANKALQRSSSWNR